MLSEDVFFIVLNFKAFTFRRVIILVLLIKMFIGFHSCLVVKIVSALVIFVGNILVFFRIRKVNYVLTFFPAELFERVIKIVPIVIKILLFFFFFFSI